MKFKRSPLFYLLLLLSSQSSAQSPSSFGKGASPSVSNFQRYAVEDQAPAAATIIQPTAIPQANNQASAVAPPTQNLTNAAAAAAATPKPQAQSAPMANTPAAAASQPAPAKIIPTTVSTAITTTTIPVNASPSKAPAQPVQSTVAQSVVAQPAQPAVAQPATVAQPTQAAAAQPSAVKVVTQANPTAAPTASPVQSAPVIHAHVEKEALSAKQIEEAARLAEWEKKLKAQEEKINRLEKTASDAATQTLAEKAKYERLQSIFDMKLESLEEEIKSYEMAQDWLKKKEELKNAPLADYEQTKEEMMTLLRALKFRNLFNRVRDISLHETHRFTSNWLYGLKGDLVKELNLSPEKSYTWSYIGRALYGQHFGETRLGFCKFMILCMMILYALDQLRQLKGIQADQRGLAKRQDVLLEQFSIMVDEVRRGCFITNRYCENAINELMSSKEAKGSSSSSAADAAAVSVNPKQFEGGSVQDPSNMLNSRLAEDSIGRADYYELMTDNKTELNHRIFQLLLHLVKSSNQTSNNQADGPMPLKAHLLYLEWLSSAHHRDFMNKIETLDDKLDLVNLQVAAATECIYNDCVAQIRESSKWLPFLELIEAYVARDIEGTFRDLIKQFCANSKDEYVIQQLTTELHKLGGIFDQRSQKALNGLDNTCVREKYRDALLKAQEKFLLTCPCTDVSKPPERFERLYNSVDLFRKIVFGVLNQLPATSVDISNYVAQVYGADADGSAGTVPMYSARDDEQQPNSDQQREHVSVSPLLAQNTRGEEISYALPDPQTAFEMLRAQAKPPSSHTEYVELFREQVLGPYYSMRAPPQQQQQQQGPSYQEVSQEANNDNFRNA